jgi:hypothetical protein
MNTFVAACRREWRRLGVPEAVANEMASDLGADLAEAESDGVSPEEVLGNGFFDPESFASSWATARGVVEGSPRPGPGIRRRPWARPTAGLACAVAVLLGAVVLAAGRRGSSVAVAGVPFRRPAVLRMPPVPGGLIRPQAFVIAHQGAAFALFGAVLLLVGLVGSAVTLWLWRPWSGRRRGGPSTDGDVGMPSFL